MLRRTDKKGENMATNLDFYERTEEYIGVSVSNPAVGADVLKAMTHISQEYEKHHGQKMWDDSITVRADEERIYFEFRGSVGGKSRAVRDDG